MGFAGGRGSFASVQSTHSPQPGQSLPQSQNISSRVNNLTLSNLNAINSNAPSSLPSPTLTGPSAASPSFPRTQNPADQNPPINTLYVGGLPAVLPSLTGPMSAAHLEDGLRAAFSRCQGFKRLCFRQKSNGPMCFVEFEDVHYAAKALNDMYGNSLSGLVKGGIRLSFSKNPLGIVSLSVYTSRTL